MIELLVFQPTSFCNLDCGYCYVPDRNNRARMDLAVVERTVELALKEPGLIGDRLEVLWHAGEPLAVGLPFFEAAARRLGVLDARTEVVHSIQTNGTLIDDAWCAFFSEIGAEVGVSLDGPRDIHDRQRKQRNGRGSFDATMRGIDCLQRNGLEVSTLSVLTPEALGRASDFFEFFVSAGVSAVGFNVEEAEGEHASSSLNSRPNLDADFATFMAAFIRMNAERRFPLWIREVQSTVQALCSKKSDATFVPDVAEAECGRIVTVARNGDVSSWSPELASGQPDRRDAYVIGNVFTAGSLREIFASPLARELQADIDRGRDLCRASCGYFGICGGGSPANKIYENGTFASTSTIKCRLQVRGMADLMLDLAEDATPGRQGRTARAM